MARRRAEMKPRMRGETGKQLKTKGAPLSSSQEAADAARLAGGAPDRHSERTPVALLQHESELVIGPASALPAEEETAGEQDRHLDRLAKPEQEEAVVGQGRSNELDDRLFADGASLEAEPVDMREIRSEEFSTQTRSEALSLPEEPLARTDLEASKPQPAAAPGTIESQVTSQMSPPAGQPDTRKSEPLSKKAIQQLLATEGNPESLRAVVSSEEGKRLKGRLDRVDFTRIEGWAYDPAKPDEPVMIEVYDGDTLLVRQLASDYRKDLKEVGLGNGNHAFSIHFSESLLPFARHLIRVRVAKGEMDLRGSPVVLQRHEPNFDPAARQFVETMVHRQLASARSSQDVDTVVQFFLEMLNDAINTRQALPDADHFSSSVDLTGLSGQFYDLMRSIVDAYPTLSLPTSNEPEISIIIPVYNKFDYTYRCLSSIAANPPATPFEVIVVDDRSDDVTMVARTVLHKSVRIIRNDTNLGFVRNCNKGAKAAKGRYLYFLNNDTEAKPGFLDELLLTFRDSDNIGIAGSKLLFPNGRLQEVGGIIWRMGDGWNWGRDQDPVDPRFMYMRDADYVSGAALMIDKTIFDQLGGFDELYAPAYYEDTDLCFRVREFGKRVVVQPASEIVHFEGVTSGTDTAGTGVKRFQAVNHRKFLNRWTKTLSAHRYNGEQPELEAERNVTKRAIFIDDTVPTPDQDAGSNAAIEHMRSLQRLGYKVTFVPGDNMAKIDPYTAALQRRGIECLYHPHYSSVEDVFKRSTIKYDLLYLHRFSNAAKYAGLARRFFPNARLVYNVADLHFLRLERQAAVENRADLEQKSQEMQRGELAVMGLVDAVIVHSSHEADLLKEKIPGVSVFVLPWTFGVAELDQPIEERSGVAFIGGYRHLPNVDAAQWLASEIMPRVLEKTPHIVCHLVGSNMPNSVAALGGAHVRILGWVPSLKDIFSRVRLTVASLRYGAGLKGKVLESFAAGIPCVLTPVAAEGIELPKSLRRLVGDSAEAIADIISKLHDDKTELERLSRECRRFISERYSTAVIDEGMATVVGVPAPLLHNSRSN